MAGGYRNEGGNHLEQDSFGQTTVGDIDRGLHSAVGGQGLIDVKWRLSAAFCSGWTRPN